MKKRCTTGLAAVAVAVALPLAGPGNAVAAAATWAAAGQSGGAKAIAKAYSATIAARTARVSVNELITLSGKREDVSSTGVEDLNNKLVDMTTIIPGLGATESLIVGTELYLRLPPAEAAALTPGKTWGKVDLNKFVKAGGGAMSQLAGSSQTSVQFLSYLGAVTSGGIATVGSAKVHGVATTEYAATVDLAKVAVQRPALKAAMQKLESETGSTTLPIKVWLDGQDRLRQGSFHLSISSSGVSTTLSLTFDLWDFGNAISVKAPPSSEVVDITKTIIAAASASG